MHWPVALALLALALSGCSMVPSVESLDVGEVTPAPDASSNATTPAPLEIRAFTANATGLEVVFAFEAGAASAGNATVAGNATTAGNASAGFAWSLDFGDGAQANGTAPPGLANHTYAAAGVYNATLQVGSGADAVRRTLAVEATDGNATGPLVVLLEASFTGSLPLDGATSASHAFAVPAGGLRLTVVYTSDHVGLFSAVAEVFDPTGGSKLYSLDACDTGVDPPAAVATCTMVLEEALAPGDWAAEVYYQAGQVVEDYTLDVKVEGHA